MPWDSVWRGVQRAAILGRPGEGKSTLLQWTCRAVASDSLLGWTSQTEPLDTLPIPIFLRAARLLAAGSLDGALDPSTLADPATAQIVRSEGLITPPGGLTAAELRAALRTATTCIFIDALDEPPDLNNTGGPPLLQRTAEALRSLGTLSCRLFLSVRGYAWRWHADRLPFRLDGPDGPDRMAVFELGKLSNDQRRGLIGAWHPPESPVRDRLRELLDIQPMVELTNNALLLTLLASAAHVKGRVIGRATRRAQLYDWLVQDLVAREDRLHNDPDGDEVQGRIPIIERAAWQLWRDAARRRGVEPVESDVDENTIEALFSIGEWNDAVKSAAPEFDAESRATLLDDLVVSGLLVREGSKRRIFPQTLFEYLAGAGMVQELCGSGTAAPSAVATVAAALLEQGRRGAGSELVKLAIGHLAIVRKRRECVDALVAKAIDLAYAEVTEQPLLTAEERGLLVATIGEGVIEAGERDERLPGNLTGGPADPRPVLTTPATRDRLREVLLATMRNSDRPNTPGHVTAVVRARAGVALGWIGDPRFEPDAFWLPRRTNGDRYAGWVYIPGGAVTMGSPADHDAVAYHNDDPGHFEEISTGFFMAKWQVTVAQWAAFLQASGYNDYDVRCLGGPPHAAVVHVSAEDADCMAVWMTTQLHPDGRLAALGYAMTERLSGKHLLVRLATDVEWEFVAKWAAGRRHRYGPNKSDYLQSYGVRDRAAVGSSARGGVKFLGGWVEDMAGSVDEWTSGPWRRDYRSNTSPEPGLRAVRGGTFDPSQAGLRSADRWGCNPRVRNQSTGFRLLIAAVRSR